MQNQFKKSQFWGLNRRNPRFEEKNKNGKCRKERKGWNKSQCRFWKFRKITLLISKLPKIEFVSNFEINLLRSHENLNTWASRMNLPPSVLTCSIEGFRSLSCSNTAWNLKKEEKIENLVSLRNRWFLFAKTNGKSEWEVGQSWNRIKKIWSLVLSSKRVVTVC